MYRKLALKYHPDVALAKLQTEPDEETRNKVEERFKEYSSAYERLLTWIEERDAALEQSVQEEMQDKHPYHQQGLRFTEFARDKDAKEQSESFNSTELTETIGKLRVMGKAKQVDKMKMLEQMIQEEMALRLPQNLNAYLMIFCFSAGAYAFYSDFQSYYRKLSTEGYRDQA